MKSYLYMKTMEMIHVKIIHLVWLNKYYLLFTVIYVNVNHLRLLFSTVKSSCPRDHIVYSRFQSKLYQVSPSSSSSQDPRSGIQPCETPRPSPLSLQIGPHLIRPIIQYYNSATSWSSHHRFGYLSPAPTPQAKVDLDIESVQHQSLVIRQLILCPLYRPGEISRIDDKSTDHFEYSLPKTKVSVEEPL